MKCSFYNITFSFILCEWTKKTIIKLLKYPQVFLRFEED